MSWTVVPLKIKFGHMSDGQYDLNKLGLSCAKLKFQLMLELKLELKLKLVSTSPVGGWTKMKLMLFSTKVEVVGEVGVELGNNIKTKSP